MKLQLTLFNNIFDNKTDKKKEFDDWDHLERFLYKLSKVEAYKPARGETDMKRRSSPLISSAIYEEDTTRANMNVIAWSAWCAVDVDTFEFKDPSNIEQELFEIIGEYYYVCYSTSSSSKEQPKFRVVFPLKFEVEHKHIKPFWYGMNQLLGTNVDAQTKDLSRMFYVPGRYIGCENNFIFTNKGKVIDPFDIMDMYPFDFENDKSSLFGSLSGSARKEILNNAMSHCDNYDVHWSSYRDCPFVSDKKIKEYQARTSDWYSGLYNIAVSIAGSAKYYRYPITGAEIEKLLQQIDRDNGEWYKDRPLLLESERAIAHVFGV